MRKKDVNKKGKTSKKNIDFVSKKMFCSDVIFLKAIRKGIEKAVIQSGHDISINIVIEQKIHSFIHDPDRV